MRTPENPLLQELGFFGLAVLRGIIILVLYDVLRIFRRMFPHGVWSVALEDFLYWILSALLVFQLIYRENDGAVRGYALMGIAAGMMLYHQTVSEWLVRHIAGVLNGCLHVIERPVRAVGGKFCKIVRLWHHFFKNKLKNKVREFIIILFS